MSKSEVCNYPTLCVVACCAAESRRPVENCFLAVLSSHGEEGCVFGADGKPVQLSRIFAYFDNDYMDTKTKLFLIQVANIHFYRRSTFTLLL